MGESDEEEDENKIPQVKSESSESDLKSPSPTDSRNPNISPDETLLPNPSDNSRVPVRSLALLARRSLSDSELLRHESTFKIPGPIINTNIRSEVFPPNLELNNNPKIAELHCSSCCPDNSKYLNYTSLSLRQRLRLQPPEIVAFPVLKEVRKSARKIMSSKVTVGGPQAKPMPPSALRKPNASATPEEPNSGTPPPPPPPTSDSATTIMALMQQSKPATQRKPSLTGKKVNFASGKPQVQTTRTTTAPNGPTKNLASGTNLAKLQRSKDSVKTLVLGGGQRNSGDSGKLYIAKDFEDEPSPDLSKLDILSMIYALPMKKSKSKVLRAKPQVETEPVVINDPLVIKMAELIQYIEKTFKDYASALQESLDLLTFPCSMNYEPLSRIKGMFWIISRTARLIKGFDVRHDTKSVKQFILKEAATLEGVTKDFNKVIGQLVHEGKNTSQSKYKKPIKEMVKFIQTVTEIKIDPEVIGQEDLGPIYKTTIDPMTINYYEKDTSVVDYEQLSVELIWTPGLTYFRSFRGRDWFCIQKTETNTQVKVLQATMQLVGSLFTEIKFIMENATKAFETRTGTSLSKLEKLSKQIKNHSISKIGSNTHMHTPVEMELQTHLTRFLEKRAEVAQLLGELKEGLKWITAVMPGVLDLAPLVTEELEEFLEREHHLCVPLCAFLPFCPRITHPFLFSNFEFMLLSVPLSHTLLITLFTAKSTRHSNNLVEPIMKLIDEKQKDDFKIRRAMETQILAKANAKMDAKSMLGSFGDKFPGSINHAADMLVLIDEKLQDDGKLRGGPVFSHTNSDTSMFFSQPSPNVYNIGHIYTRGYRGDESVKK